MKRKKNKQRGNLSVDAAGLWSLVKMLADGSEELLASGLTWGRALSTAEEHLANCRPGETVSLREALVWEDALLA